MKHLSPNKRQAGGEYPAGRNVENEAKQPLSPKPQRLLGEGLRNSANAYPDKVAVRLGQTSYTYRELLDSALKVASALQDRGLNRGDRVVIFMDNSWPCIVSIYGVLLAGGVFIVVNPNEKSSKLKFIIENSGTRFLFTDGRLSQIFIPVLQETPLLEQVIISNNADIIQSNETDCLGFDELLALEMHKIPSTHVISSDLAALIYTSGTEGKLKGVMQTHQAMLFSVLSLIEYLRLSFTDVILLVLPISFDYGLYQLLMAVNLGATVVVENSFTYPSSIYKKIKEEHVTVFPGVPSIFAAMLATNRRNKLYFPGVTRVTSTAAHLPVSFIPDLKKMFPNALIYKMYGQTECKRISFLDPEYLELKPASVGKAIPGTEVFILSKEGQPVGCGESGILYVRGPHVMLGYWDDPGLTAEVLKDGLFYGDRVLCTHDSFHMDDDGFLYFEGRSDDMLNIGGFKISIIEVESALYSIPGVVEAAVVGSNDPILGQAIRAYLVVEDGIDLTENQIKRNCLESLGKMMVPKTIVFLDKMPKTHNGKIDKKLLISMV